MIRFALLGARMTKGCETWPAVKIEEGEDFRRDSGNFTPLA